MNGVQLSYAAFVATLTSTGIERFEKQLSGKLYVVNKSSLMQMIKVYSKYEKRQN